MMGFMSEGQSTEHSPKVQAPEYLAPASDKNETKKSSNQGRLNQAQAIIRRIFWPNPTAHSPARRKFLKELGITTAAATLAGAALGRASHNLLTSEVPSGQEADRTISPEERLRELGLSHFIPLYEQIASDRKTWNHLLFYKIIDELKQMMLYNKPVPEWMKAKDVVRDPEALKRKARQIVKSISLQWTEDDPTQPWAEASMQEPAFSEKYKRLQEILKNIAEKYPGFILVAPSKIKLKTGARTDFTTDRIQINDLPPLNDEIKMRQLVHALLHELGHAVDTNNMSLNTLEKLSQLIPLSELINYMIQYSKTVSNSLLDWSRTQPSAALSYKDQHEGLPTPFLDIGYWKEGRQELLTVALDVINLANINHSEIVGVLKYHPHFENYDFSQTSLKSIIMNDYIDVMLLWNTVAWLLIRNLSKLRIENPEAHAKLLNHPTINHFIQKTRSEVAHLLLGPAYGGSFTWASNEGNFSTLTIQAMQLENLRHEVFSPDGSALNLPRLEHKLINPSSHENEVNIEDAPPDKEIQTSPNPEANWAETMLVLNAGGTFLGEARIEKETNERLHLQVIRAFQLQIIVPNSSEDVPISLLVCKTFSTPKDKVAYMEDNSSGLIVFSHPDGSMPHELINNFNEIQFHNQSQEPSLKLRFPNAIPGDLVSFDTLYSVYSVEGQKLQTSPTHLHQSFSIDQLDSSINPPDQFSQLPFTTFDRNGDGETHLIDALVLKTGNWLMSPRRPIAIPLSQKLIELTTGEGSADLAYYQMGNLLFVYDSLDPSRSVISLVDDCFSQRLTVQFESSSNEISLAREGAWEGNPYRVTGKVSEDTRTLFKQLLDSGYTISRDENYLDYKESTDPSGDNLPILKVRVMLRKTNVYNSRSEIVVDIELQNPQFEIVEN
jgi:hypothetical protein